MAQEGALGENSLGLGLGFLFLYKKKRKRENIVGLCLVILRSFEMLVASWKLESFIIPGGFSEHTSTVLRHD